MAVPENTMATAQPFPIKHVGSFTLLFFLSVLRPAAIWPDIPFSFAPLTVLATGLLLLYKINATVGFRAFWQRYKIELLLVIAYQALCLISLLVNQHRYSGMGELVQWGLTPIIVQGALPAAIFLFLLPQNKSRFSISQWRYSWLLPLSIALLIPLVAIWQAIDNQSAYSFYQYFIAGNLNDAPNIRSILAVSTDLGAISALLALASLYLSVTYVNTKRPLAAFTTALIALLSIIAGINSGARVFILMMGVGLFTFIIMRFRHQKGLLISALFLCAMLAILAVQFVPTPTAAKLANFFPFILPLNLGIPFIPSDFIPDLSAAALGDRAILWQRAIEQITQHPILGISNGGFRLLGETLGETAVNNTHNLFIQTAIDAGLTGTIVILCLLYRVFRKVTTSYSMVIFVACCAGLLVDNFTDHSLPWILTTSYLVVFTEKPLKRSPLTNFHSSITPSIPTISVAALLIVSIIISYKNTKSELDKLALRDLLPYLIKSIKKDYWHSEPIMLTTEIEQALGIYRHRGFNSFLPSIKTSDICKYAYHNSMLITSEKNKELLKNTRKIGDEWILGNIQREKCKKKLPTQIVELESWITNHYTQHQKTTPETTQKKLRLFHKDVRFFSPIISIERNSSISIVANRKQKTGKEKGKNLEVSIINVKDGKEILEKTFEIDNKKILLKIENNKPQEIYIKIGISETIHKNSPINITEVEINPERDLNITP
jgi:O-antigen ligase